MKNLIDIKLGYKCNNRCKFCVQGEKRRLGLDKTSRQIKAILRNSRSTYDEVVYTGGEATIRPDIIELVSYAKDLGFRVHIQTNARMFAYEDFCKALVRCGAGLFTVSIHGHNAELHDYLTGVKGSFEQTTQGIKNLLSLGCLVFTNTVITRQNYRFLPQIAHFLADLGVLQYNLSFPHILGRALTNRKLVVPRKKDIAPYVQKSLEIGLKKKLRPSTEAIPYCFLGKYTACASERRSKTIKVFDTKLTEDFAYWRRNEGTLKGVKCQKCRYFLCCEGPWREYPRFYGWDEFKPAL